VRGAAALPAGSLALLAWSRGCPAACRQRPGAWRASTRRPASAAPPGCSRAARYAASVLERTQTRALPLVNRAVDLAPAAQACCGVCRTCATTNIVGLAIAGVSGAAVAVAHFARRFTSSS
jgi:hypothetical protein